MKLSTFLVIKAVISIVFGLFFVLQPAAGTVIYGISLNPAGIFMTRVAGALFLGVGLACWFLSKVSDKEALKGFTLSFCIADTIGFLVSLIAQLGGLMNPVGWINVLIWLLLALGLGYFRFFKL